MNGNPQAPSGPAGGPEGREDRPTLPASSGDDRADFAALYRRLDEAERALANEGETRAARRRALLAARARTLGAARDAPSGEREDVIAFTVAGERFGVPTVAVDGVLDLRELSPLPGAPPELAGMIRARDRVVPVLDPRPLLGLSGGGMSDLTQAISIGGEAPFALAVERVEGRVEAPTADGGTPPPGPFLRIAADGLALLDVARVVAALPRGRG